MARIEADREDLFEELQSARCKWELRLTDRTEPVLLGVRHDNRLSVYLGPDPCYHFDAENRLLRAYVGGYLYRTQGVTLARLLRQRDESTTTLLRHDLTTAELQAFREQVVQEISQVTRQLVAGEIQLLRSAVSGKPSSGKEALAADPEFLAMLFRLQQIPLLDAPLAPPFRTRSR